MCRIARILLSISLLLLVSTGATREIQAPPERAGFSFVVFGDRTHGRPAGLKILEQAVTVTNRLDPDFVMTVGDLVQGYTDKEHWLSQCRAFRNRMDRLRMPWFPVAGHHDVRGKNGRPAANEALYREHFGPLATRSIIDGPTS